MKKKILFVGRFTPPVHGAAVMDDFYFNSIHLNKKFDLKRVPINKKGYFDEIGKLNLKYFSWFLKSYTKLIKNLIFYKPDLIYFEIAPKGAAFYRDSLYVLACKLFSKKVLFHLHARNLERNFYSKFIFRNSKIIILSKVLIGEVTGLFDKKSVYFLPNGIPESLGDLEFKNILKKHLKSTKPKIIFLSNMIEEKGTLDLLKICKKLHDKKVKFEAIFSGSWPDEKTKDRWFSMRNHLELEKYCIYVGESFGDNKKKILEDARIMIFPTKYKNESFPLVVLEAFMFGIPTLAYDNGALNEMVSKNYLGEIFNRGDLEKMSAATESRLKNQQKRKKIRDYFKKNYTFHKAEIGLGQIFDREIENS